MESNLKNVRVIRYLRHNTNLGGFTFMFDLNYETRNVEVYFSICSRNENFCKADGLEVAICFGVVREFDLDDFRKFADEHRGFVPAYIAAINTPILKNQISERETLLLKKLREERFI